MSSASVGSSVTSMCAAMVMRVGMPSRATGRSRSSIIVVPTVVGRRVRRVVLIRRLSYGSRSMINAAYWSYIMSRLLDYAVVADVSKPTFRSLPPQTLIIHHVLRPTDPSSFAFRWAWNPSRRTSKPQCRPLTRSISTRESSVCLSLRSTTCSCTS